MNRTRRPKVSIEQLEHRDCPSFTLRLTSGHLFVTGTPTTQGATSAVRFTQTANNKWQVIDGGGSGIAAAGGFNLGTYNAANVTLLMAHHQNASVIFDLGGNTAGGNILASLGTGNTTVDPTKGTFVYNGRIGGNLTILGGSGKANAETVRLGTLQTTGATVSNKDTSVGGNVAVIGRESANNPGPDGALFDTGTNLPAGAISAATIGIGGSLNVVGYGGVGITPTTTIGKDLTITNQRTPLFSGGNGVVMLGRVNGNMTVTGLGTASTGTKNNDVVIASITANATAYTASVGGNLTVTFGSGNDRLTVVNAGGAGVPVIGGNTSVQSGDGNSSIGLNGLFQGNLTLNLGNGANTDAAGTFGVPFFPAGSTVSGNFTLRAGNGNNNFTPSVASGFAGTVNGNTLITLGNGSDSAFHVTSPDLGGKFIWRSGNGNDTLNFAPAVAATYNVDIGFGNGDDSLALNPTTTLILTGRADGGGQIVGDAFFQGAGATLVPAFQLSNFP